MPPAVAAAPEQSSQPISPASKTENSSNGDLIYPVDMKDTQDRIMFTAREIKKSLGTTTSLKISDPETSLVGGEPKVFLPIQPSITDQNTADWGAGQLNELQRRLVNTSLKAMNVQQLGQAAKPITDLFNSITKDPGFKGAGQLYFAEQAVGVQGLLSRATGNVLNPNLELLFQGPQLRPFQFQFKLSPRSKKEADTVKKIIKFFKKNMAVKRVEGNLFLKAPYVFGIEYQHGTKLHESMNKIKTCALQACGVDYTPLGSYMTYDDAQDSSAPMVSYNISLQFQEIIPIYDADYDDHQIGY